MNRIYARVWSQAKQSWVVTSELVRGSERPRLATKKSLIAFSLGALFLQADPVLAVDYTNQTLVNQTQDVNNAETATSTTVNSGGVQNVNSGGSATSTTVNNSGTQNVNSGGSATSTTMNGGIQNVNSGGSATSTTMNGGIQNVNSGGSATYATMNGLATYIEISSGGSVTSSIVDGGTIRVSSGASASDSILSNQGALFVRDGGSATSTIVNSGGAQMINSGGSGNSAVVNSGGMELVDGLATSTTVNSGGLQSVNNGGSAISSFVNSDGKQNIGDGGLATNTLVNSGGEQNVSSSGSATSTTVASGGIQNVNDGGAASLTMVNGGTENINSGGTATSTTVASGGIQNVNDGGSATSTTVSDGGVENINSGGSASTTLLNAGGVQNVSSGGSAISSFVNSDGKQNIGDGGLATNTLVNSGGEQNVSSSGSATSTTVASGGIQNINDGGAASLTMVNGGTENINSGGTATSTTVASGGIQNVNDGGAASLTMVNGGTENIISGGTATSTTVASGGILNVNNGGSVTSSTLNDGGIQNVSSGGLTTDTLVNSGGTLSIAEGGKLAGTTTLTDGATLAGSSVINDGNLLYNLNGNATWHGELTGKGVLTKEGTGKLTLSGNLRQQQTNLNSGMLVMDNLQAITDVVARAGTQLLLENGTSLTGVIDPTDVTTDSSSTWNITGDSLVGTLSHAGNISFTHQEGGAPHTLTVTNLKGNGGTIALNTVLGDSSSPTDKVIIDGGQATGNTHLVIMNRGGLGAQTTGSGIAVVKAVNGATTGTGAFDMKSGVMAGAYKYSLYRNADQSWYLTSKLNMPGGQPPQIGTTDPTDVTPGGGHNDNEHHAGNNYRGAMWNYAALATQSMDYDGMVAGTADTRRQYQAGDNSQLWGRIGAGQLRHAGNLLSGETPESTGAYSFLQLGSDVWQKSTSTSAWRAGIYGAAGLMNNDIYLDNGQRAGNNRDTVYTGGLYLSGESTNGLRMDSIVQMSHHSLSADPRDGTTLSTSGTGWLASVEGGWTFNVGSNLMLEPQLQYTAQGLNLNDSHDGVANLSWSSSHRQKVRAGLKFGKPSVQSAEDKSVPVSWWVTPSVTHGFGGSSHMQAGVNGVEGSQVGFSSDQGGTGVSLEGGMDAHIRKNVTLGVRGGYDQSLEGNVAGGYYGQINLKVSFH
ncbi:AIDA repeat-containing protein [Enterobacter wuhouensis]|uniref:AIDA repeat-containing protein n=1 Tax=Enterobacter wuhouensis TaxID=2529381 RepID=UPI003524B741